MRRKRGFGYCGLACCLCKREDCSGCVAGDCEKREWCKNFNCCREKDLKGCWECEEFPCTEGMLDKARVRAFAKSIAKFGEERLLELLKKNEESGIVYHYENSLKGDYDVPESENEIMRLIEYGRQPRR